MRVLIVGSNLDYALERYFVKHLSDKGVTVKVFASADQVQTAASKSFSRKVLFRLGLKTGYRKINDELLAEAATFRPDIIWVFKGMEIYPRTLSLLKKKGIRLVNYNPDHPFVFSGRGSGNDNVTNSVKLYDLHFSYHGQVIEQIRHRYNIPVVSLPFGYELTDDAYAEAASQEEINKVCLIGSPDKTRIRIICSIAESGFQVDVYGNNWNKKAFSGYPGVKVYPAVLGQDFWNRLRQYRVQLNIFRKHNIGSHNMRTFEVPAVGGILLSPFNEEQAGYFEVGKEVFYFYDEKDLVQKIGAILAMPKKEIERVRENARRRSLLSDYSYSKRAEIVIETFQRY